MLLIMPPHSGIFTAPADLDLDSPPRVRSISRPSKQIVEVGWYLAFLEASCELLEVLTSEIDQVTKPRTLQRADDVLRNAYAVAPIDGLKQFPHRANRLFHLLSIGAAKSIRPIEYVLSPRGQVVVGQPSIPERKQWTTPAFDNF